MDGWQNFLHCGQQLAPLLSEEPHGTLDSSPLNTFKEYNLSLLATKAFCLQVLLQQVHPATDSIPGWSRLASMQVLTLLSVHFRKQHQMDHNQLSQNKADNNVRLHGEGGRIALALHGPSRNEEK